MNGELEDAFERIVRSYVRTALRHERQNIDRHNGYVQKVNVPLATVIDLPSYQRYFAYHENYERITGFRCYAKLFGAMFVFFNESLVKALALLTNEERLILFLHYGFGFSDGKICRLLNMKNRSTLQYRRKRLLQRLRTLMTEMGYKHE